MKQANSLPFRTHFFPGNQPIERVSQKSDPSFVPHQAIKLSELVARFQRGQRLNVHMTTPNEFYATDEEVKRNSERFEDCPPADIHDIVDVMQYQEELDQRKSDLKDRIAKKKAEKLAEEKKREEEQRKQTPPSD